MTIPGVRLVVPATCVRVVLSMFVFRFIFRTFFSNVICVPPLVITTCNYYCYGRRRGSPIKCLNWDVKKSHLRVGYSKTPRRDVLTDKKTDTRSIKNVVENSKTIVIRRDKPWTSE